MLIMHSQSYGRSIIHSQTQLRLVIHSQPQLRLVIDFGQKVNNSLTATSKVDNPLGQKVDKPLAFGRLIILLQSDKKIVNPFAIGQTVDLALAVRPKTDQGLAARLKVCDALRIKLDQKLIIKAKGNKPVPVRPAVSQGRPKG